MSNYIKVISMTLLVIGFLSGCSSYELKPSESIKGEITLSGSSTVKPVMEKVAEAYNKHYPDVKISIKGGGSSVGVIDAGNKRVNIGMASRHLKPFEKRRFPNLKTHVIGYDALALIVNKQNPISNLAFQDVQGIYTGEIRNWKEVGGEDNKIVPLSKDFGRSSLDFFVYHFDLDALNYDGGTEFIIYKKARHISNYSDVKCKILGSNEDMIATVEQHHGSFGYISHASAVQAIKNGANIKIVALDGILPTEDNIYRGTYPLRRDLNLIAYDDVNTAAKELIEFTTSVGAKDIMQQNGFLLNLR